jgi:hypothetical protein
MTTETSNAREPDVAMALHWIDRYAAGIDDECQIDLVADALGVTLPDGYAAAPPPAAARGDVRGLVALAEQMERDADVCRRDGYIDAAVVKEDCAQRIRQTLGISAIAGALAAEGVQAGEVSVEDVAVLHRLKAALPDVGVNGWYEGVQALERVLARLSQQPEAQAQGGGEVAGWVLEDTFVNAKFWTADTPPQGWTPVYYTAPPSAPVEVEGLLADLETIWHSVSDDKETNAAYQRLKSALAQQPDAVSAGGCVANGAHVWCNGHVVATAHGLTLAPYRAARIAACLNACAGIADPGALVQAARDAVDWIVDYVPDNVGGRDFTLANLRRAMGGAAQSADAEAQASEARGVVNLRKVRNNVLAVIPGGNICDPQQVADDVRAVFAIFEAEARNGR